MLGDHQCSDMAVLLHAVIMVLVTTTAQFYDSTYVSPDNRHCFMCPPGMMVLEHCQADLTHSSCASCLPGYYMDKPNSNNYCFRCHQSKCPQYAITIQNCTNTTNHVCHCTSGYHRYPLDNADDWLNCREHTDCKAGQGIVYSGNHSHDRACRPCYLTVGPGQEFVNKTDPENPLCQLCSQCLEGFVEKNCSSDEDARCGTSNENVTYTPFGSTIENLTQESESLGIVGKVLLIIFSIIIIIIIIIIIVACYYWRKNPQAGFFNCMQVKLRKSQSSSEATEEDSRGNGKFKIQKEQNGTEKSLGYVASEEAVSLMLNGEQCENVQRPTGAKDLPDVAVLPSDALAQNNLMVWDPSYIRKNVFIFLANNLGHVWKHFFLMLPASDDFSSQNCIENAEMNEKFVKNVIFAALTEWSQACPHHVTKINIVKALKSVERNDIIHDLLENKA